MSMVEKLPKIVSFFINNRCQLNCRHCYVGYKYDNTDSLSIKEWKKVFDDCIEIGTLTFGLAGKEPLLGWDKTKAVLNFLKIKKEINPKIRFGIVTNGLLLNNEIINDLEKINPDYIDISLDGDENTHDKIRGKGTYKELMDRLHLFSSHQSIINNIFIAITLNKENINSLHNIIFVVNKLQIKNFVISPYITNAMGRDPLYLESSLLASQMKELVEGELLEFSKYSGLNIFFKSDCFEGNKIIGHLIDNDVINLDHLFIDEYGTIFNKYRFDSNTIYFNYPFVDDSLIRTLRISHDGYVGNCYDMFFENYPERAIGNVLEKSIREILENRNVFKKEYAGCDFP